MAPLLFRRNRTDTRRVGDGGMCAFSAKHANTIDGTIRVPSQVTLPESPCAASARQIDCPVIDLFPFTLVSATRVKVHVQMAVRCVPLAPNATDSCFVSTLLYEIVSTLTQSRARGGIPHPEVRLCECSFGIPRLSVPVPVPDSVAECRAIL